MQYRWFLRTLWIRDIDKNVIIRYVIVMEVSSSSSSSKISLQDKGLPQPSPHIFASCLSIPDYLSKSSNPIPPSSSLSVLLSFTTSRLPFVTLVLHILYIWCMTCSAHVHFFLLPVVKMSSTLVYSIIHDSGLTYLISQFCGKLIPFFSSCMDY